MKKSKKEIVNSQANPLKRGSPEYMAWLAYGLTENSSVDKSLIFM